MEKLHCDIWMLQVVRIAGEFSPTSAPGGSLTSLFKTFHPLGWQPNHRSPVSGSTSMLSQSEPTSTAWWHRKTLSFALSTWSPKLRLNHHYYLQMRCFFLLYFEMIYLDKVQCVVFLHFQHVHFMVK